MNKLVKKYKIVYSGNKLLFDLISASLMPVIYPGKGTKFAEFDSLDDAKNFIENNNLVYEEPVIE